MAPNRAQIALAAAMLATGAASAQPVTSSAPDSVSVTIYRNPDRPADRPIELGWLRGYALVTEQRTVTIPAGRAVIRFEGVAGGMLPESAIVTGLPDGVREKNLDADLLSPGSLYARSLGRPVTLRRAIGGKVTEEQAIIRSGAEGSAILETRDGFVAANCGPEREQLVYDRIPAGLSARPTLSVETESTAARTVTLTLSYLAWNFDWQANYVATMRADNKSADLFAWVTLANGDPTSFADAEAMVVAGKLEREDRAPYRRKPGQELVFHCFFRAVEPPAAPAPPAPPAMYAPADIVVTGARRAESFQVRQEELGDLKLYRVPFRTTVASNSQKQVALLDRQSVPVEVVYRSYARGSYASPTTILLRAKNRKERGLGLPLPAGGVAVFEPLGERRVLIGEGAIGDKAVNEDVEIEIAAATQVHAALTRTRAGAADDGGDFALAVTNANPFAVRYEAVLTWGNGLNRARASAKLARKDGRDIWAVEIPANGSATLRYSLTAARTSDPS